MEIIADFYEIRRILSNTSPTIFQKILKTKIIIAKTRNESLELSQLEESYKIFKTILINNDCISLKDLKINGEDLKEIGITNGKEIGEKLKFLLNEVLKNPQNNDIEILKKILKEMY